MVTVGVGLRWPAGWWGGVLDVDGVAFQRLGVHVVRSAQPLWWWSRPRTASRAQLMAAARVTRSVVMRARPRVRALRPPQARRVKWVYPPRGARRRAPKILSLFPRDKGETRMGPCGEKEI